MVLDSKLGRRYDKLLCSFLAYVDTRLPQEERPAFDMDEDTALFELARTVWDGEAYRYLVDEFVAENPVGLSNANLREVARWKNGLFGMFVAVEHKGGTLFMSDGYAFDVRGITREPRDVLGVELPVVVQTVLLPFDSFVTFALSFVRMDVGMGANFRANIKSELAETIAAGKVVSSGKQLCELYPQIVEQRFQNEAEDLIRKTELDMNAHVTVEGEHVSAYRGASDEERRAVMEKRASELLGFNAFSGKDDMAFMATLAETVRPPESMAAVMRSQMNKQQMIEAARALGVTNAASMNKTKLSETIVEINLEDVDGILMGIAVHGSRYVNALRRVVEAGGELRVSMGAQVDADDYPEPHVLYSLLWRDGDELVWTMFSEIRALLGEVDWDDLAAKAEVCQEAVLYIAGSLQLRGAMDVEGLYKEYCSDCRDALNPEEFETLLSAAVADANINIDWLDPDDPMGFVTCIEMIDVVEGAGGDPQLLDRFFEKYESDLTYAPVSEEMRRDGVVACVMKTPQARALLDYLDEHVPDGRDDLIFSDSVTRYAIEVMRWALGARIFTQIIQDCDLAFTEAVLVHFLDLVLELQPLVPRWDNLGWTPGDMCEMFGSGGIVFEDSVALDCLMPEEDAPVSPAPAVPVAPAVPAVVCEPEDEDEDFDYDAEVKRIEGENDKLLIDFEQWLKASGISQKTINGHLDNVSFYLNHFLTYYDATSAAEGICMLDEYLGDWFIRKAMWSTPTTIKSNAASIKKFYKFMAEKGLVSRREYQDLCDEIKESMEYWQDTCARYNNPYGENPFFFGGMF